MERQKERDPMKEEESREHGHSDRGGTERRPMDEQQRESGRREPDEPQRGGAKREEPSRKSGGRRDQPAGGQHDKSSR